MKIELRKKVLLIPPGGMKVKQDFSLIRIAEYFQEKGIETHLLQIGNDDNEEKSVIYTDFIINVGSQEALIDFIRQHKYDLIFHRTWMHRYAFAAIISETFDNVVVYIKDWHNGSHKQEYAFLYNTVDDYEGIKRIFESSKLILTHFTEEQFDIWHKTYGIAANKFFHFPEMCSEKRFAFHERVYNPDFKLAYAGSLFSTAQPNDMTPGKSFFKQIMTISKKFEVQFFLLPYMYERVVNGNLAYQDYLFEHRFNNNFKINKGKDLCHELLNDFHFGLQVDAFIDPKSIYYEYSKYAVTSKLAFYMEAGLPMLINKKLVSFANLIEANGIGLVYEDADLVNIDSVLNIDESGYNQIIQNVKIFREKFTYNDTTMKPILEILQ